MIKKYDSTYEYQLTLECTACPTVWTINEIRPVDIWWQLYQKRWEFYPEVESPKGFMKAKCGACVAKEAKEKKEARKALMEAQSALKLESAPVLELVA